jgi:hypothetical protein
MAINSVQGANAYTNVLNTTPQVENTQPRDLNPEASKTELNNENANTAQQAVEVTITQEARQRLSEQNNEESAKVAEQQLENESNQNTASAREVSQIVDIVA